MSQPGAGATSGTEMRTLLERQRTAFLQEGHVTAEVRVDRLGRAIALLHDNQRQIVEAINEDFGNRSSHQTLMSDIFATIEALKYNKKHLRRWMKSDKRSVGVPFNVIGARGRVDHQPLGVVGILGTWNFPVNTVFSPLSGVLAAGNRALLKFSEVSPRTASLMARLVANVFDETEVACISGGPDVGAEFSSLALDHLVFTGSGAIGKQVMKRAAENLTPVTLELGGKSPVIVTRDTDLELAAVRIMTGKALNVGQACLAPDYVMIPEDLLDAFLRHATAWVSEMFPTMVGNPDYTSIVNERHQQRLLSYLEEAREAGADVREVNPANEDFSQQSGTHKIPLTFVVNPSDDLTLMREEIFGPILAIKTYSDLGECIRYINARPRPLGLYLFSSDRATQARVLDGTLAGGVTINDVIMHASVEDLPFGGVGPSGMGHYHGRDGFRSFSHARPVYSQSRVNLQRLGGMVPPYGERCDKTLDKIIRK